MSTVMGPVDGSFDSIYSSFDGKRPPRWNGHNRSYEAWKEDVKLWNELTDLVEKKRAMAIIGQLDEEPKNLAKTLRSSELCKPNGVEVLIELLNSSYALSKDDRTDADLMDLLDWSSKGISTQHFLSGFN